VFLEPVLGAAEHGVGSLSETTLVGIAAMIAVAAIGVAWWIWGSGRVDWESFGERQPELQGWLANAFYVNQLYAWLVRAPGLGFGRFLRGADDRVVDGAVNEVAEGVGRASRLAPVIQRGLVRAYALAFLLGAAALLLYLGLRF
jgi:NADH-quinone oxidoreductase subunit L